MRAVSIYSHDLQDQVRRERPGQYGFVYGHAVMLVTGGKLKGRAIYEHYGFAWQGQTGGLRVDRSLIPRGREAEIVARVTADQIDGANPIWLDATEWIDVLTL